MDVYGEYREKLRTPELRRVQRKAPHAGAGGTNCKGRRLGRLQPLLLLSGGPGQSPGRTAGRTPRRQGPGQRDLPARAGAGAGPR